MEVQKLVDKFVTTRAFKKRYADVFKVDKFWRGSDQAQPDLCLDYKSTYVRNPPYFDGMSKTQARSPTSRAPVRSAVRIRSRQTNIEAGSIKKDSPAGAYLG